MPYNDPLASLQVPALSALVTPFADYFGYTVLPKHVHEILLAALFYHCIFLGSSRWSKYFWPGYKTLNSKTQTNFDIHVVSMVQCNLILGLSMPLFCDPDLAEDHVYGYTPYSAFIASMAVGYFLWDAITSVWYVKYFGVGFAVHGIAAGFVFLQGMRPLILHYCPHFLLFELSTPFLNVNWFATHMHDVQVPFLLRAINGAFLLLTFFFVRIVWGFYMVYFVFKDLFSSRVMALNQHPQWISWGIVLANIALNTLNVYWFYKMQNLARRALSEPPSESVPALSKPQQASKKDS